MLHTYGRQLTSAKRLARFRRALRLAGGQDPVTISREAKRRELVEKVAREIVENLIVDGTDNPIVADIQARLEQDFGERYVFEYPLDGEDLQILRETKEGPADLGDEEKGQVMKRLWTLPLPRSMRPCSKTWRDIMEIKKFIGQLNPYENNRKVDQTAKDGAGKGQKADKGQAQTSDTVNLSDAAKLLGTARSEAQRSDGVRKEKVAELKERIASGGVSAGPEEGGQESDSGRPGNAPVGTARRRDSSFAPLPRPGKRDNCVLIRTVPA